MNDHETTLAPSGVIDDRWHKAERRDGDFSSGCRRIAMISWSYTQRAIATSD
jgi:hypothetical protein